MNIKKPNFWDQKTPNLFAYLLLPIALIIRIFTSFKKKPDNKKMNIKTICVGNFYIGGTGKTSLCIKINKILKKRKIKSCFIKKFYKNQADEQKLLENNGKLFLSLTRREAIQNAINENYEVAILDDGIQDKSITYDLNFICFNNINWIGNGMTIPAGPLREDINNLKNYDHVFLNGNLENLDEIKTQILKINSKINIHLGKYEITNLNEFKKGDDYLVFSGIGNHSTFIAMLKEHGFKIKKDFEFSDHYQYVEKDLNKIISEAELLNCKIITTEKDFLRLNANNDRKIKFIKSELNIIDEEKLIKSIS
jgi:tetraacyldisaccharide 4'-kinase